MAKAGTNGKTKDRLNFSDSGPRFGSTKLVAAAARGALTLAVLSTLLQMASLPAQGQNETGLYNFCTQPNCTDGANPLSSLTSPGNGNFYGTTELGGLGYGTVFELSPNGGGGWNETVLYNFTGKSDGGYPLGSVIFDGIGTFYGTASQGGVHGYGVVFALSFVPPSGWIETPLYSFANTGDGAGPASSLILDPAGNLYGTTNYQGAGNATVFELTPSGAGSWTEQTIYAPNATEGSSAGVTMDAAGNIFGVTLATVFKLSPNGGGGWTPAVIHTFTGGADGYAAEGTPVLDPAGNLYGTTAIGGHSTNNGTVWKLSPGKNGVWKEKILYFFKNGKDDFHPWAGVVLDAAGNIYGTTAGTSVRRGEPRGTVFELLAPVGTGSYIEKILWSFNGTDGNQLYGGVILDSTGHVYGTTTYGGSGNSGVVFEVKVPATWTTATLSSSPNPSTSGQPVIFTAMVTSTLGPPPNGGTVTFMKGLKVLGTGTLSGGSASFTTSTLPVGTSSITAVYGGDSNFGGSTSKAVKQVVNP